MDDMKIIDLTPENIADYGVCGYKDMKKHPELRRKIDWFNKYFSKGLRIKIVISEKGSYQGMLEYIPGKYAHRPVETDGYMFIHCIWVGFLKEFKGRGYATALIQACIDEAKNQNMKGVAVVTRKGSFMAKDDIFLKLGFEVVDTAEPDFHLLAMKFDSSTKDPRFKADIQKNIAKYKKGLTILRSPQCPYSEKNVDAMVKSAREQFNLDTQLINLDEADAAQNSPCPFGVFCMIYDGKIISHHPISNTRFITIMQKLTRSS
ncbi:MAG: GNAT family N-acetyltransferase [Syntrophomonadaceae bacterium]